MSDPKISVVMSVYNGEEFLGDAIRSILAQTFENFEFIIIDDGSTDRSLKIVRDFYDSRIIVIRQENRGLSEALNTGIRVSQGKFIARADADDISLPTRFEKQYEALESNSDYIAVGSWINWIDRYGAYIATMKWSDDPIKLREGLPFRVPVPHAASMYRSMGLKGIGGYKDVGRNFFHEDLLLMIDLASNGEFYNLQEPLANVRLVPSSNTQRALRQLKTHDEIVRHYYFTGKLNFGRIQFLDKTYSDGKQSGQMAHYYLRIGKMFLELEFRRLCAVKNLFYAMLYQPMNRKTWFNLFLCCFPRRMVKKWKEARGAVCQY